MGHRMYSLNFNQRHSPDVRLMSGHLLPSRAVIFTFLMSSLEGIWRATIQNPVNSQHAARSPKPRYPYARWRVWVVARDGMNGDVVLGALHFGERRDVVEVELDNRAGGP
jgi:hypothetical protein